MRRHSIFDIQLSAGGLLGCDPILATVNSAVTDMDEPVSLWQEAVLCICLGVVQLGHVVDLF